MNNNINEIIEKIKKELSEDPNGPIKGKVSKGIDLKFQSIDIGVEKYYEFLKICNGARFGDIDFFSFDNLDDAQYFIEDSLDDNHQWMNIGQILYEPLVIDKKDGRIYQLGSYPGEGTVKCYGEFDDFLLEYVFGEKYKEIIPDSEDDEWYKVLKKLKIVLK